MGSFKKLTHTPALSKLWSSTHYNYGLGMDGEYYAWGFPNGYVLGNGKEEPSITSAR